VCGTMRRLRLIEICIAYGGYCDCCAWGESGALLSSVIEHTILIHRLVRSRVYSQPDSTPSCWPDHQP